MGTKDFFLKYRWDDKHTGEGYALFSKEKMMAFIIINM